MTFHPVTFFLSCLTAFVLMLSPAYAFLGKDKIPPLKDEIKTSQTAFEAESTLIEEVPLQNKDMAFHVRLPKGWIKLNSDEEKTAVGSDLFRQIAAHTSPPRIEHRSIFRVKSIDLTTLISVDDWFIGYMLQMGFSVEGMTSVTPKKLIAQYTLFEDGEPYVTRAVVTITGAKIILAEYLVHQEVYETEKDQQVLAMSGFDLVSPNTASPIVMKTFSFVDIAKFDYPSNWFIYTPGISQINRMEASVLNTITAPSSGQGPGQEAQIQMAGRVDVSVISKDLKTTVSDEIKTLNDELKAKNYKLGKYIETAKSIELNSNIKSGRIDIYEMDSEVQKLVGYEYWVAVLQTDSRYYLVRLITIGRDENFSLWAQNVAVYRTLLQSLSPASTLSGY